MDKEIFNIINKPINNIGRCCNMLWIDIGNIIEIENYKKQKRNIGEYAIHIQTAWRITDNKKILIARNDIFTPKDIDKETKFDFNNIGDSIFDNKIETVMKILKNTFITEVQFDEIGSLKIYMNNKYILEVFPENSVIKEFWRFMDNKTHKHIVVFDVD